MKKFLSMLAITAGLSSRLLADPIPLYENFGNNDYGTNPPVIDAVAFANYGVFGVQSTLPYDFQNTVNFTNAGTMNGLPGFRFDTASSSGPRRNAANFINASEATVASQDIFFQGLDFGITSASYLLVNSTNIENHGLLQTGAGGLLDLRGSKVDLSNGGLEILPLQASGLPFITPSNFFPDIAIYDQFWGGVTNQGMNVSQILQGGVAVSPVSLVTNVGGFISFDQIVASGLVYYSLNIQTPSPTNMFVQAVFVGLPGFEFQPDIVFANSQEFGNFFKTAVVRVTLPSTDVVTGNPLFEDIFLVDRLASSSNYTTLYNLTTFPDYTYRPSNYELSRSAPFDYFVGSPGNSVLTNNIFTSPDYSNTVVTNLYGAYSAFIDSQPVVIPPVGGSSITNVPGRIEIRADSLDLSGTRMRGNSFIYAETKNLISSTNAVVDTPDLSFQLTSTNGLLKLQNLIPDSVIRMKGTMNAWSGLWTNQSGNLSTNIGPDPNDPTVTVTNVVTNIVDIGFHVLIVDCSGLSGLTPVTTHALTLTSTNVVIDDNPGVTELFRLNATTLTLNGSLTLNNTARDWNAAAAPNLLVLSNQGSLFVENNAFFGSDRATPYSTVVNRGSINSAAFASRSAYFENAGSISDNGVLQVTATDAAFLQGGSISSGRDVFLTADTAKFDRHTITASRGLHFTVTNSLSDSGATATNRLTCQNGFDLTRKPVSGDLLGTTLQSTAPNFVNVQHTWAAENRGATPNGYSNNVAVGRLSLNSSGSGHLTFKGTGANNALYVDFLQLSGPVLSSITNAVTIASNLVIYFADASVPVDQLDGKFGGHLVWVPSFAGPNSSVDTLRLNGQTEKMNRALRNSTTIDTDGDGVANAFDVYPLDPEAWNGVTTGTVSGKPSFNFAWFVPAGATYQIESTTNLAPANWQPVPGYGSVAISDGIISITDTNLSGSPYRFYRIRYNP